jgi:hypothetical protein
MYRPSAIITDYDTDSDIIWKVENSAWIIDIRTTERNLDIPYIYNRAKYKIKQREEDNKITEKTNKKRKLL